MVRRLSKWLAIGLVAAAAAVFTLFAHDMRQAYERIEGRSTVVSSPTGEIEFTQGGSGPAVLVIHGSGGGFDQGELIVQAVLGDRVHWIAPSRFGYLRSTFQAGATFDEQAEAYVHLLDHLRIQKVAVVALSHGGPSALLLAALHPDRVTSLTLISAGVASWDDDDQSAANEQGDALTAIFQRDYRYWAVATALRGRLLDVMGANRAVIAGLTPDQRALADRVIDFMNPVAPRSAGVLFDNRAAMPNERIAAIRAPTLILHAKDDTLQLYRNAEYAAATIPGARFVSFEQGGHLLMVVEQARLRALIDDHIRATARE